LPKNLRHTIKQLSDGELDRLFEVAFDEAKRRGRLPWNVRTESTQSSRRPSDLVTKRSSTTDKAQRRVDIAEVLLTRGQVNVIRAAFKAGVPPSRIARQLGISQANVRKALASEELRR
jgi:predicted DNA binding protein